MSVVSPRNQPPPRRRAPNSRLAANTSAPLGSASASAIVAFATTSGMSQPQPVVEPLPLVAERVLRRRDVHVDVVALDLDREAAQVVGPLVERAAGAEVEARVVPVAREDPVADRPAVQGEAHVRAAVVDRVHLALVGEQADRVALDADDEPALGLELLERGGSPALRGLHDSHRPAP